MKSVKKNWKIALDVLMLILLTLMFKKKIISMAFHEIAGLALIVLFIVHHLFNGKWISAITTRLFKKETPAKTKIQYAVDALLLVAFIMILVSGMLISKVVFQFNVHGGSFKTIHYFCSALAIVLIGIHIGLHLNYLFGACTKGKTAKFVATALSVLILAFGVYSMTTTSFLRWLAMPVQSVQAGQLQPMENSEEFGQPPASDETGEPMQAPGNPEDFSTGNDSHPGKGTGNGQGKGLGQGKGQGNAGQGQGNNGMGLGNGQHQQFGLGYALLLIANYISIAGVFAAVTGGIEWLIRRSRKSRLQPVG